MNYLVQFAREYSDTLAEKTDEEIHRMGNPSVVSSSMRHYEYFLNSRNGLSLDLLWSL